VRDSLVQRLLRSDRAVVMTAVGVLTAIAWAYVWWLADSMRMHGMDMSGFRMIPAGRMLMVPAARSWAPTEFVLVFAMWAVMMVGMMMPSAAPMILLYARVGRDAMTRGSALPATAWFLAGYLLVWVAFSGAATLAEWALDRTFLMTPSMSAANDVLGATILIVAGVYQWTSIKRACLRHCQSPWVFVQQHGGFRREAGGALAMGVRHGLYCLGCCWALMTLLFVGGVMNLLWIAALTVLILIEKITPAGRAVSRAAGVGLVAFGVWMIAA
jgi:predicted metal-binding membrane protein